MKHSTLTNICQAFAVTGPPSSLEEIERGCIHIVWRFTAAKKQYILKQLVVAQEMIEHDLFCYRQSEHIANDFAKQGINAVYATNAENDPTVRVDGHYYMLYEFVEGTSPLPEAITLMQCRFIANELKRLHSIELPLDKYNINGFRNEINFPNFDAQEWKELCHLGEQLAMPSSDLFKTLLTNILQICGHYKSANNKFDHLIISHRDVHVPNVIWECEDKIHLIDWELAGPVNPTIDALYTAIHWSMNWPDQFVAERFKTFIQSYQLKTDYAEDAFTVVMAMWLSWLRDQSRSWLGLNRDSAQVKFSSSEINRTLQAFACIYPLKTDICSMISCE